MPGRASEPRPRKALGQHFLRDREVLERIADAVPAGAGETIVEVGAGTGELTEVLTAHRGQLVALELDERLARHLTLRFREFEHVRIVEADARAVPIDELAPRGERYHVVGNLPYYAANPIVRRFLEVDRPPASIVVMVQREVAREMANTSGKLSMLSVSVEIYARSEYLFEVGPEKFDPPPKVTSAVIRLTPRDQPLVMRDDREDFFRLVSGTFKNPRKQLHNALGQATWLPSGGAAIALEQAGIDSSLRPERLTVSDWLRLLQACREVVANA